MRLKLNGTALQAAVLAAALASALPTAAQQPATTPAPDNPPFDVDQLFAGTCGFCHADGGRAPGRGPQLMDSPRDDDFIRKVREMELLFERLPNGPYPHDVLRERSKDYVRFTTPPGRVAYTTEITLRPAGGLPRLVTARSTA